MGAGAALGWNNAPTTSAITETIRQSGFKNANDEYVTDKIYQWLSENGKEPNFETILSVIEDFIQFWMKDEDDWPSGLDYFVDMGDNKWEDFIDLNTNQILVDGDSKYSIKFPRSEILTSLGENISKKTHPNSKYFELLMIDLFETISAKISDYSFYTDFKQKFYECKENSEINGLVEKYIKHESKDSLLRIYSLNYDKIFQVLFQKANIPIIQGFKTGGRNIVDHLDHYGVQAQPKAVLFERDKHCIYHLHGNANWIIKKYNDNGIKSYEYRLKGYVDFNKNNANIGMKMEQGKLLFLTNIVTGYQKTQRTSLSPLRQMTSAFDMDCYTADEMIIVGYSFGDEHINDIIRQAKKENSNLKIKIIDPSFDREKFTSNFITNWGSLNGKVFQNCEDGVLRSKQYNVEVYMVSFECFLKKYADK